MDDNASLPGADVALAVIRMISESGMDVNDEYRVDFTTRRWDRDTSDFVEVGPHYVTSMLCSDTFFWGSADEEEVTAENIHVLREVLDELLPRYKDAWRRARGEEGEAAKAIARAAYEKFFADNPDATGVSWRNSPEFAATQEEQIFPYKFAPVGDLFAARVRGMRPQGAAYKVRYDKSIWHLFNECGPERETGLGNPKEVGQ